VAIVMVVLFPVFYVFAISFNKSGGLSLDISAQNFSLNNWKYVLRIPYQDASGNEILSSFPILTWLVNSIKVSLISSLLMLFLATTSAYSLSRFRFRGRQTSLVTLMLIQMFPNAMAMVAFYLMLDYIGRYMPMISTDTHLGLILVYLGGTPFNIWLIKGYFDTIPKSIEESAIMDGCSRVQAFTKIILPLSTPILAVVALITFINTFADYLIPSILLKTTDKLTFSTGIQIFISDSGAANRWGAFAAACIIASLPTSILFLTIHRHIISGLGAGATKG
jgi:maltose/maltodextrin transport system permease protein